MARIYDKYLRQRITRRRLLQASGVTAVSAGAIALVGCGSDNGTTTNGGATWAPKTDELSILNHGCVALDPSNPEVVYLGTGEYTVMSAGDGMFRSLDGGITFERIATTDEIGSQCSRIIIDPTNSEIIHHTGTGGYARSIDGGTTWQIELDGSCSDLALNPNDPSVVYVARHGDGVYRSADGGASFERLSNGLPNDDVHRIVLSIAASNPQVLYAAIINAGAGLRGLYKTTDGGASWSRLNNTPDFPLPQGWYDCFVGVDPTTLIDPVTGIAGDQIPFPDNYANPIYNRIRRRGTSAAGRASAVTNNGIGTAGMAPNSWSMPVRYHLNLWDGTSTIYGFTDVFTFGRLEKAINYTSGHNLDTGFDSNTKAHAVGMMTGMETYDGLLYAAIQQARANGCVLFCPSGNSNRSMDSHPTFPQVWQEVIVVGGSRYSPEDPYPMEGRDGRWIDNNVSSPGVFGSSYGWSLDVVAPIHSIVKDEFTGDPLHFENHSIVGLNWNNAGTIFNYGPSGGGVSAAMPLGPGLAALMLFVEPILSPTDIQVIMQETAEDQIYTWTSANPGPNRSVDIV
ncbi:MAG: S8 family serine peptidase, partial [Chloroflexi bacterium]|nr:S8 family serine peptidase [Chloroflexota bacterium]